MNPTMSGQTTSAPSFSSTRTILLFAIGEYLTRISPTMATRGFFSAVNAFFMKGINCSFFRFIRSRAIYDALEQVSVKEGQSNALDKRKRQFEARRLFGALGVKRHRDDRNLRETGILECFSDQRNIVCRTTSASLLTYLIPSSTECRLSTGKLTTL